MCKVSYRKRIDRFGYVYNQAITIGRETYREMMLKVDSEIALGYPRAKEYTYSDTSKIYLKPLPSAITGIIYLNRTQTRFINIFLRLDLKDRNTCLLVRRR